MYLKGGDKMSRETEERSWLSRLLDNDNLFLLVVGILMTVIGLGGGLLINWPMVKHLW